MRVLRHGVGRRPCKEDLGGDTIKMRLGFVLDRGVVFAEAKRWLAGTPIDPCTLRPIQVTYTAAPLFHDGLVDPLAGKRLGMLDGGRELVAVPAIDVQQPGDDRAADATYGPALSAEGWAARPRLDAALQRLAETGGAKVLSGGRSYRRRFPMPGTLVAIASISRPWPTPWPLPQRPTAVRPRSPDTGLKA